MRLGEEVGRRRDQQHFGALDVERILDVDAGIFLDVLFQALQRVEQGRAGQAEVVADLGDLAENFVGVLLAVADVVENFARRHGDFGGVDAVGAEHRTAPAFGALVEIGVPLVEHFLRQVAGADEGGEELARRGEVAAIDAAHQVLARHRHVLGIAGAEEVMALVGAGAAMHAGVHEDLRASGTCPAGCPSGRWPCRGSPASSRSCRGSRWLPGSSRWRGRT